MSSGQQGSRAPLLACAGVHALEGGRRDGTGAVMLKLDDGASST
jgi:hypothetical protein